jgi:hypothetical protein
MPFRVGLLQAGTMSLPNSASAIADILRRVEAKSRPNRDGPPITLISFVRTPELANLAQSAAALAACDSEVVTFDQGGVSFGPAPWPFRSDHAYHERLDFDLGLRVLLFRCTVVIVACGDNTTFTDVQHLLSPFENTDACIAFVTVKDGATRFFVVNPVAGETDLPTWLVRVETQRAELDTPQPELKRKITVLGLVFPLLNSAILGRWSETIRHLTNRESDKKRCESGMGLSAIAREKLVQSDRDLLDTLVTFFCPSFNGHDLLGTHYSNVFRTACLLVPFSIAAATILAVAAVLDPDRHLFWLRAEGVFLLCALIFFTRAKFWKHHQKWVEHRLFAEFLRPALLNSIFCTLPELRLPTDEPAIWIERSGFVLRQFRTRPDIVFTTDRTDLLSARVSALADFAAYQASWHKDFAEQHRVAGKWLTRLSSWAFTSTLIVCALQLVIAYFFAGQETLVRSLVLVTLTFACCAFALSLLSHQLGFETIAERSTNAAERFHLLHDTISRTGYNADARRVYEWWHQCATAIVAEQHSWYRHIPFIRMHL